jgi:hypothetical protein
MVTTVIEMRCKELFWKMSLVLDIVHEIPLPSKFDDESPYSITINSYALTTIDRVILALGIAWLIIHPC